jgi:tetratricopeptide (TPR) repeat protein
MASVAVAWLLLQAPDYSGEGLKALDAKKYEQAAGLFQKAITADPKDYAAHFNLALADGFLKRDTEAIAEYQKVLELKPGLYEAELNLAILLIRDKQAAAALPHVQRAAEQKPKEFRPQLYWAAALLDAGDAAQAEVRYRAALELNPKSAAAELGLAQAQARQNRLADAAPHFRAAAQLDPGYRDALLELAELYEKNHQDAEAMALYREFPDNPGAQEHLGDLLLAGNHSKDAIPALEAAVQKDPTAANRLALATAYVFNQQLDKALPLLEQSVAANPDNYSIRMIYGRALRDKREFAPAAQQFFQATKLKPDSRQAWNDLAGVLYMLEKYPETVAALDRSHQLGDDSAGNYFLRAITLDKLRVLKPALENYQQFLARSHGEHPDQEFQARQRARIIERELNKR